MTALLRTLAALLTASLLAACARRVNLTPEEAAARNDPAWRVSWGMQDAGVR